jgi:hypothetical protein
LINKQQNLLNLCLLLTYIIVRRVYLVLGSYYLQQYEKDPLFYGGSVKKKRGESSQGMMKG